MTFILFKNGGKKRRSCYETTKGSLPALVPEVMVYYSETSSLYGIDKLKFIGSL